LHDLFFAVAFALTLVSFGIDLRGTFEPKNKVEDAICHVKGKVEAGVGWHPL